jgi:hypothetical protein
MLHAILDKTTGHFMEMRHLLVNPKYKELWGKSYKKELGSLAQGIPGVSKGMTLSSSYIARTFHTTAKATSRTCKAV